MIKVTVSEKATNVQQKTSRKPPELLFKTALINK